MRVRRRLHQLLLVIYGALLLASLSMVVGPMYNDYHINQDPGRALARVTAVGSKRTTVEYQAADGIFHAPEAGVFYPTGLGEGQNVWVTYSRANPDLVKVENRSWTLAIIPALSVAGVSTAATIVLWWLVGFVHCRASLRTVGRTSTTLR